MPRLPIPGSDNEVWGSVLNEFLAVEHNSDGTLKDSGSLFSVVHKSGPETITGAKTFSVSPSVPAPTNDTDAATKLYVDSVASSGAPDANATTKGILRLTNHLAGTADAPEVAANAITNTHINASAGIAQSKIANLTTDLANKQASDSDLTAIAGLIPINDDIIQRKAGAWTNRTPAQFKADLTLTSSDVGLGSVPNVDATARANHTGTQNSSTISDFTEAAQDATGSILTDTTTINMAYDDAGNAISASAITQMPITSDASGLKLSGDEAAPGNTQYYGTDGSGAKGFHALPISEELVVNVKDFGAIGDGVADDTAAIQAAIDSAPLATSKVVFAAGTFLITSTIVIKGNFDGTAAVFNYGGTGTAVQVGTGTGAFRRALITLPRVLYTAKPGTGWVAGTRGVMAINTHSCIITVPHIYGFESGLVVYGQGTGNVYTTFHLGHIDNNKRNIVIDADSGGWSNQNTFVGGLTSHDSSEGTTVAGVTHVRIENTTFVVNNNVFINISFENSITQYAVDIEAGLYNMFFMCRWENADGVRWGPGAQKNQILYGNSANLLNEVKEAGSAYNTIIHSVGGSRYVQGTIGEVWENSSSSNSPFVTLVDAGATGDPATAWRSKLAATDLSFKTTAAANPMYSIGYNGIKMGNGTVAQPITLSATSSSFIFSGGPFLFGRRSIRR